MKKQNHIKGNETVTNCHALKLEAIDGKMRLIQSISRKIREGFVTTSSDGST